MSEPAPTPRQHGKAHDPLHRATRGSDSAVLFLAVSPTGHPAEVCGSLIGYRAGTPLSRRTLRWAPEAVDADRCALALLAAADLLDALDDRLTVTVFFESALAASVARGERLHAATGPAPHAPAEAFVRADEICRQLATARSVAFESASRRGSKGMAAAIAQLGQDGPVDAERSLGAERLAELLAATGQAS